MRNFKHIVLPQDHGFSENELKFLETIDGGLTKVTDEKDRLQEQINGLFVEIEKQNFKPYDISGRKVSTRERELNTKWLKTFLRGKDTAPVELELKEFESYIDTTTATGGAYVIPELLQAEINRYAIEGGIARREMRYLPFAGAGNTRNLPVDNTSASVQWVEESEAKPLCTLTLDRVQQTLKKVACISTLTEELLEDSAVDLVDYIARKLGEAIAAEEDNQYFCGVGTPWTGILNDPLVTNVLALAAGVGPLDMRPEALLALTVSIPATATAGAKFYMHRTVYAAICARRWDSVAAGDAKGGYLVQQPNQGPWPSIWGFPVVLVDAMPSLTDLGYGSLDPTDESDCDPDLPFVIFGNLQKSCVYGDKVGVRVKLLDQATLTDSEGNSVSLAQYDMLAVRVFKRTGYVTVLPDGIAILCTGPAS